MQSSFQNAIAKPKKKKKRKKRKAIKKSPHVPGKRPAGDHAQGAQGSLSSRADLFDNFLSTPSSPKSVGEWCADSDENFVFGLDLCATTSPITSRPSPFEGAFRPAVLDIAELPAFDMASLTTASSSATASSATASSATASSATASTTASTTAPATALTPQSPQSRAQFNPVPRTGQVSGTAGTSIHAAIQSIVSRHITNLDLPKQAGIPLGVINQMLTNFMQELRRQDARAITTTASLRAEITSAMAKATKTAVTTAVAKRKAGQQADTAKVCDEVYKRVAVQILQHTNKTDNDVAQLRLAVCSAQKTIATLSEEVRQLKSAALSEPAIDDVPSKVAVHDDASNDDVEEKEEEGEEGDERTGDEPSPTPSPVHVAGPLLVAQFVKWTRCASSALAQKFLNMCGSLENATQAYFFCPSLTRRSMGANPTAHESDAFGRQGMSAAPPNQKCCGCCGSHYATYTRVRVLGYRTRGKRGKRDKIIGILYRFPKDIGLWNMLVDGTKWYCTACWEYAASEREHTAHCPADGLAKATVVQDPVFQELRKLDFATAELRLQAK